MKTAPVRVVDRHEFATGEISNGNSFFISIRETIEKRDTILRPALDGQRLTLFFGDCVKGRGLPKKEHVRQVLSFSRIWLQAVKESLDQNGMAIHCTAGISRSTSMALIPLLLFYENDLNLACQHLFHIRSYSHPNTHIVHLIEREFKLESGSLQEAVYRADSGQGSDNYSFA
jgi:predicted protein tyrosine phosphatase